MQLTGDLFSMALQAMRHATSRQALIAENIANADTPGFAARDLEPISGADRQQPSIAGRRTDPRHLPLATAPSPRAIEGPGGVAGEPNGNTISVEDQLMRAGEAQRAHDQALAIFRTSLDVLRAPIRR